ncbi:MAG: DNA repair protein RecN [Hyphomonadaceae bacterium]
MFSSWYAADMLTELTISDFVLLRSLRLELGDGFTALTGETGAGKSVLLAALDFALGGKGSAGLVREGADAASVTACFEPGAGHPVRARLEEAGLMIPRGDPLIFRRVLKRGSGARAFLNDQPVSAGLLRSLGGLLADIHGQHSGLGLLNPSRHRDLLDSYAEAGPALRAVSGAWAQWRAAVEAREKLEASAARSASDRDWIVATLEELDRLDPQAGETHALALRRAELQAGDRVVEAVQAARSALSKAQVESALVSAAKALSRALALPALTEAGEPGEAAAKIAAAATALDRALIETAEARSAVDRAAEGFESAPEALEEAEVRLFALRAAARKHDVDPDGLPGLRAELRERLDAMDSFDQRLAEARAAEAAGRDAYAAAADGLSAVRAAAAVRLSKKVGRELGPLKLGAARLEATLVPKAEAEWGASGREDVVFRFAANPGAGFTPLHETASGGEVARVSLALSVCLASANAATTLVFDEADMGVGGAVAAAVGERLARLGRCRQVLAITHSPQVAAAAGRQLRVSKSGRRGGVRTQVETLAPEARQEEIARMLAGASVTREARAAAGRLLAGV